MQVLLLACQAYLVEIDEELLEPDPVLVDNFLNLSADANMAERPLSGLELRGVHPVVCSTVVP